MLRFKTFISLLIVCGTGCTNTSPAPEETTTILLNHQYKLLIETRFSTDTLDVVDYREDSNSSPVILDQYISFYENDKLIKRDTIPTRHVMKQTIGKKKLRALQAPVYQICLTRTNQESYYLVFGTGYCMGVGCPEFTGIYSMRGKALYEGLSTDKDNSRLGHLLSEHQIDLNKHERCREVDIFNGSKIASIVKP